MNFPVENGWSERGAPESSEKVGSRPTVYHGVERGTRRLEGTGTAVLGTVPVVEELRDVTASFGAAP